jgi:hypothetical protein
VKWSEADAFCRSANMNLVSLDNADKDREVINTINNAWSPGYSNGYFYYWTSGCYNSTTARYEWTATGQPLTYSPPYCCFGPTQPCDCPTQIFPSSGQCIINHGFNGFWLWTSTNTTESVLPFTCEDRNY